MLCVVCRSLLCRSKSKTASVGLYGIPPRIIWSCICSMLHQPDCLPEHTMILALVYPPSPDVFRISHPIRKEQESKNNSIILCYGKLYCWKISCRFPCQFLHSFGNVLSQFGTEGRRRCKGCFDNLLQILCCMVKTCRLVACYCFTQCAGTS